MKTKSTLNLDVTDKIRETKSIIDVPTICVYGVQKELLLFIEGISGISLPSGLTCMHEFRVRDTDVGRWVCEVSLIRDIPSDEEFFASEEVTFLSEIYDPKDAAMAIVKAQRAIFNPSQDLSEFRKMKLDEVLMAGNEKEFSEERISVRVLGAPFNFSFVALPEMNLSSRSVTSLFLEVAIAYHVLVLPLEEIESFEDYFYQSESSASVILIKQPNEKITSYNFKLIPLSKKYIVEIDSENRDIDDGASTVTDCSTSDISYKHAILQITNDFDVLFSSRLPEIQLSATCQLNRLKKDFDEMSFYKPIDYKKDTIMLILRYCDSIKSSLAKETYDSINYKIGKHLALFSDALFETQPKLVVQNSLLKESDYMIHGHKGNKYWHYSIEEMSILFAKSTGKCFSHLTLGKTPFLLVTQSQQGWYSEAETFVARVRVDFTHLLQETTKQVLSRFPNFMSQVNIKSTDFLNLHIRKLLCQIKYLYQIELSCSSISDTITFERRLQHIFEECKDAIDDPFDMNNLIFFATSVAYYDLSYHRFCDTVHMALHTLLLNRVTDDITEYLLDEFNAVHASPKSLSHLLRETPKLTANRDQLLSKIARLEEITAGLTQLSANLYESL